jgi:hypothetical protein
MEVNKMYRAKDYYKLLRENEKKAMGNYWALRRDIAAQLRACEREEFNTAQRLFNFNFVIWSFVIIEYICYFLGVGPC